MTKKKTYTSFEEAVQRLEEISQLLEREDLGLDDAVSLYEEGIELSKICFTKLKEAELKVTTLKANLITGEPEESDFSE